MAAVVGSAFTAFAFLIEGLNVVPALGTALWVLCSNALINLAITDCQTENPISANVLIFGVIYMYLMFLYHGLMFKGPRPDDSASVPSY